MTVTDNMVTGLVVTLRIELDKQSVDGGEALSLGACIQSLTTEGWRLTHVLEGDDGSLTAVLWRGWDVGVRPPSPPTEMSEGDYQQARGAAPPPAGAPGAVEAIRRGRGGAE